MLTSIPVCQISIHAPLAGSDIGRWRDYFLPKISIHAPLAGSDRPTGRVGCSIRYFNPRSPCGERLPKAAAFVVVFSFQSTLPLRGATSGTNASRHGLPYFNPRSPCGERAGDFSFRLYCKNFNPRSPCGERRSRTSASIASCVFQSTLPLRGATRPACADQGSVAYFNPRSPCGERRHSLHFLSITVLFQSTLPLRGATTCDSHGCGSQ